MKNSFLIILSICFGLSACVSEIANQKKIYKGYYWRAMEEVTFAPLCKNVKWWIHWDLKPNADYDKGSGWDRYPIYMVIEGSVTEKGRWGHIGGYPRRITINKVIYFDNDGKFNYRKNRKKCE